MALSSHQTDLRIASLSSRYSVVSQASVTPQYLPTTERCSQNPITVGDENGLPDIFIVSADGAEFYTHHWKLMQSSSNHFAMHLPVHAPFPGTTYRVDLPESGTVVRIILRSIYERIDSGGSDVPELRDLLTSLDSFKTYGISPQLYMLATSPMRSHLLRFTPRQDDAIVVYAAAAHHELEEIAVTTSAYLLKYPLDEIKDTLLATMGPVYLLRLAKLHETRIDLLRELVLKPPDLHGPVPTCNFRNQGTVGKEWARVTADLGWRISPGMSSRAYSMEFSKHHFARDLSTSVIQTVLGSVSNELSCTLCKEQLRSRIQDIIVRWSTADVSPALQYIVLWTNPFTAHYLNHTTPRSASSTPPIAEVGIPCAGHLRDNICPRVSLSA